VWLIQCVEWVLAVFFGSGVSNGIHSQFHGRSLFHGCMAQELGQVAHGSARAWHLGRGAGNTDVAKRVNHGHLSRMDKLVR
jgi:hypothetical protein